MHFPLPQLCLPHSRCLAIISSQPTSFYHDPISSTRGMADQIVFAHFQALFDSALQVYKRQTGITLANHFLMAQLDSCRTVEDITALFQRQAEAVGGDLQARNRIIKSIKTTVSILTPLHVAVGLVRQNALLARLTVSHP